MKAAMGIVSIMSLLFCVLSGADGSDLVWSTFLGGSNDDHGYGVAVDDSGNTYITVLTSSDDFPTTVGAFDESHNGWFDALVVKLNPTGSDIIYSSFLGGSNYEGSFGIAVNDAGSAYVTGYTRSADFPTTMGAFDTTYNGETDVFVARLNPWGNALEYATFLGGENDDYSWGHCIAADNSDNAYVTGYTRSVDFPTTTGAFDTTYNGETDVFVAKLNASGSSLAYSTFLGGNNEEYGYGIALDNSCQAYVTGFTFSADFPTTIEAFDTTHNGGLSDVFVTKLNAAGSALAFSTYLGGGEWDRGRDIAMDNIGNAYVTGETESDDFPTTVGAFDNMIGGNSDAFVVKLNSTGRSLNYATFLGGNYNEYGYGVALDNSCQAHVTGQTSSFDFPTTTGALDTTHNGSWDVFVAKLNPTGNVLEYSTFLGGSDEEEGHGIAVDNIGNAYVTGETESDDFPTTAAIFDTTHNGGIGDAFVAKLTFTSTPVVSETPMAGLPKAHTLHQNYPNPFNSSTEIRYRIPTDGHVNLKIYNTLGQQVRILMDTDQSIGEHIIHWDGRDEGGQEVSSGLYFCRLQVGDFTKTVKMMLVK